MRLWWLVVLAGCDGVFGLTHIPDRSDAGDPDAAVVADVSPLCTREDFTTISDVLSRWIRVSSATGFDISVASEQLVANVPANAAGTTYVRTLARFDMTDATASVEVPRAIGLLNSETYFSIQVDIANFYFFDVVDGQLTMRERSMGVDKYLLMFPYDPVADHFWRFQHSKINGELLFLTSPNGTSYTMRHKVNTDVPIGPMRIELGAATTQGGLPVGSEARFDSLVYCPP